ncbi:DUF364 domain-containing protein [Lacrimispora sp.]|uniref:DUF364 domain-containing protein n=1 Tax=Lacrimispora sp. TaxID=2719234 RepID=UPI0029E74C46|nr:uncharacterized protein [Lacrimispora sp.]
MWELYDSLIEPIPADVKVSDYLTGNYCTLVTAGGCMGAAATNPLNTVKGTEKDVGEMSWKEAAGLIKSWNFAEASIGAAAVNAFYNQADCLEHLNINGKITMLSGEDTFLAHKKDFRGKKVATIGHFCYAEECLKEAAACVILERNPGENDYPDTACEFLLHDMDYVFITGFTLVNKTLPRLLQLARNIKVVLVGPSIPLAPQLFEFGVSELAGTLIRDRIQLEELVKNREHKAVIRAGTPVRITGK